MNGRSHDAPCSVCEHDIPVCEEGETAALDAAQRVILTLEDRIGLLETTVAALVFHLTEGGPPATIAFYASNVADLATTVTGALRREVARLRTGIVDALIEAAILKRTGQGNHIEALVDRLARVIDPKAAP